MNQLNIALTFANQMGAQTDLAPARIVQILPFLSTGDGPTDALAVAYRQGWTGAPLVDVRAELRRTVRLHPIAGVSDYSPVVQAIHDLLEQASPAGGTILVSPAEYPMASDVFIRCPVRIVGEGWGGVADVASDPDTVLTRFKWVGPSQGISDVTDDAGHVLFTFMGPAGEYLYGAGIFGVQIDGDQKLWCGMRTRSVLYFEADQLAISKCRYKGWVVDDGNEGLVSAWTRIGTYRYQSGGNSPASESGGYAQISVFSDAQGGHGVTGTHAEEMITRTHNGIGVAIGQSDNNTFKKVVASKTGTGNGLRFLGYTSGLERPSRKCFIGVFSGGDIYCEAGTRNVVQWVNSEGTNVTIEADGAGNPLATLDYRVLDRRYGRRWAAHAYKMDDKFALRLAEAYNVSGSAGLALVGSNQARLGMLPKPAGAVEEALQWTVETNRDWSGGKVYGVQLWVQRQFSADSGIVSLKLYGQQRNSNATMGSGSLASETAQVTLLNVGNSNSQRVDLILATPWTVAFDSRMLFRLARVSAGDTLPSGLYVDSVKLLYFANVADGDGSTDYRFAQSADAIAGSDGS